MHIINDIDHIRRARAFERLLSDHHVEMMQFLVSELGWEKAADSLAALRVSQRRLIELAEKCGSAVTVMMDAIDNA